MTSLPPDIAPLVASLVGQYDIERELGRGGMGVVYLARDVKLDREVAIKVLPPLLADSAEVRERFLREARTAARLSHPNIVAIHRADEINSRVFFVMGYIAGESLAERLRRTGPLSPSDAVPIIRDVALALAYAHERGIVHRDIKPENILLDASSGRAMVTDFGIARVAEAAPLTMTGQVLGSVHYMSPEQVSGDRLDGRSDLYSLGVVAFQALSGRLPFDNESASAVIVAHVTKAAPLLRSVAPGVPVALASVIDACLAKEPGARYATGTALARALDEAWSKGKQGAFTPPVLSEKEANAVWERAADLQAATSSHPAPPVSPLPAALAPASVTSGIAMDRVRESAVEAGISREHVDRAAEELGLVRGGARRGTRVDALATPLARRPILTPLFAAPFRLQEETDVEGEIAPADYELIVDSIRTALHDEGAVSAFGRTLTWSSRISSSKGRNVSVTLSPRNGRTRIRIDERLGQLAGGLYGGIVGGTSSLAVWAATSAFHATHAIVPTVLAAIAVELTTFSIARTILGLVKGKRERQLTALRAQLEADVRESIAAGQPDAR
ncbi:MAG: serine/threonine protein kinase [Gemmatimonadota bacterium]|nr:serine/threonine protein kinase [Gemmatimonadota bacterium]